MRWREEEQVIGSEASQRRNGNHDARWNVGGVVMEECACEQKNVVGGRAARACARAVGGASEGLPREEIDAAFHLPSCVLRLRECR